MMKNEKKCIKAFTAQQIFCKTYSTSLFHDLALNNDWKIIFPIYDDDNEVVLKCQQLHTTKGP